MLHDLALPYRCEGRYGTVTLDLGATERCWIVEFHAADWVRAAWGDKSLWRTFKTRHSAEAYYYALTGLNEVQPERHSISTPLKRRAFSAGNPSNWRPKRPVPLDTTVG